MKPNNDAEEKVQSLYQEAIDHLKQGITEARALGIPMANTASLATVDAHQYPSVRTVTICDINTDGLLLFINRQSGKAQHLQEQPHAGLCFYWYELHLQIVIQGSVYELSPEEANCYWKKQDRHFQLAAWASRPASTLSDKEQQRTTARTAFSDERTPIPKHWQAYRIKPFRMEFWEANWKKANHRYCYEMQDGQWQKYDL